MSNSTFSAFWLFLVDLLFMKQKHYSNSCGGSLSEINVIAASSNDVGWKKCRTVSQPQKGEEASRPAWVKVWEFLGFSLREGRITSVRGLWSEEEVQYKQWRLVVLNGSTQPRALFGQGKDKCWLVPREPRC